MKLEKKGKEYYAESSSGKGKYLVDPEKPWCECPAYKFRELKRHGICKHIQAVREYIEKKEEEGKKGRAADENDNKNKKVLAVVSAKPEGADSIELIEKFGEEIVNELIEKGELIESKGKIKILK